MKLATSHLDPPERARLRAERAARRANERDRGFGEQRGRRRMLLR